MLGEARSKFATIAGPQGGGQLNGDTLKNEAAQEMEKLEAEVLKETGGGPLGPQPTIAVWWLINGLLMVNQPAPPGPRHDGGVAVDQWISIG